MKNNETRWNNVSIDGWVETVGHIPTSASTSHHPLDPAEWFGLKGGTQASDRWQVNERRSSGERKGKRGNLGNGSGGAIDCISLHWIARGLTPNPNFKANLSGEVGCRSVFETNGFIYL